MKSFKQGLLLVTLALSLPAMTCTIDGQEGFVPENNLKISANAKRLGGISEKEFNDVIDKVETIYSPIISSMGAKLNIVRNWTDGTVNAYAQQSGKNWTVQMFGGLARHETITVDGMALVVCHELGHHIGGAPRKTFGSAWASNEGQSDYFANLKCLRRAWINDNNEEIVKTLNAPEALVKACGKSHLFNQDYFICIRGGMAGMSVSKLFQALRNATVEPKFDTPDTKVVTRTDDNHPAYQCRLDTYFQGSLCEAAFTEDVSANSEVTGTCHGSLGHKVGTRPVCWFKPLVR